MINRVFGPHEGGLRFSRLEGWLVRELQGGALSSLPHYTPPGSLGLHCPEQYARNLLSRMRSAADDLSALERAKDDGRAFRSWAEAIPSPSV